MPGHHKLTAILPSKDLDASEAFYTKLGFKREGWDDHYRILLDGKGAEIHLVAAEEGLPVPDPNPFALYLFTEDVDKLASLFGMKPEDKPWHMHEFSTRDPDGTLVRIGWLTRLLKSSD
jgi:hypothetical protein